MGETDEGEEVQVGIGRFGPFVRYGNKFVSIPKDEDPYTRSSERAFELVREKKQADANRIIHNFGDGIQILRGRYGPYVTNGEKNAKVPKEREPESLSHAECAEMIANAPARKGRRNTSKTAASKAASNTSKTGTVRSTKSSSSGSKSSSKKSTATSASSKGSKGSKSTSKKGTNSKSTSKKGTSTKA